MKEKLRAIVARKAAVKEAKDAVSHEESVFADEKGGKGKGEPVFDIKKRKMVDRKSAIESAHPLSEGKHKEKKEAPKSVKKEFSLFKPKSEK